MPRRRPCYTGGASEADYRALETIARRELGDVGSVLDRLLQGVVTQRGIKRGKQRSAHDELLAAFFSSRKDDEEEPLKASLLEDARPGRVDAVVFGTVARRDGGAVLRGRSASVLLKAHSEAYDLPLNASVAIDGCGLRKRPRDQSHQILVAARHKILVEGTGESITVEPCEDEAAASLFGEVLDVRLVTEQHVLLLVDDVDRGPVLVRAPADDLEVTLEANPSSAEKDRFISYRDAGVNRLSLGVQSLDDDALQFLGRHHDAIEAQTAMAQAREIFKRVSFDLIYARPDQTEMQWRSELRRVLEFASDHLSLYQLTIEPGTPFFKNSVPNAGEDRGVALFELTQEVTAAAGLPAYEISNHAQPGAESRHNLTYWRGGEYAGIGPGAHGRLADVDGFAATHQIHDPTRWLAAVEKNGYGTGKRRILSGRERAEEMLMTGLRLAEGLDIKAVSSATGVASSRLVDSNRLGHAINGGLLVRDGARLRTTPAGRLILNTLVSSILTMNDI